MISGNMTRYYQYLDTESRLPGTARYGAVAFGVSGKAYIGCGDDGNYLKDFYAFNPSNSWQQIVSIGD